MMWRFVSIVGAGGMGKTTVAISVARGLLDGFNGAVFFIDLATLTDAELVPIAVASALGFMVQTRSGPQSADLYRRQEDPSGTRQLRARDRRGRATG